MHYTHTLQRQYLEPLIKQKRQVHLYLKNGRKLKGIVFAVTDEMVFFTGLLIEIFNKKAIHGIFPVTQQNA